MIDPACFPLLSQINDPSDLRRLDVTQLDRVASELRTYLIDCVSRSGGHFAAGLGVIELTVALHYIFDTPHAQLVWDVGHQAYPHKILTGRRDRIQSVKRQGGLTPFPQPSESRYDSFGVGHSSTSISAALGMAIAHQRSGNPQPVVAIIGDGAMSAGMAYEALNHAGGMEPEPNLLVILNDNRMSISEAVGGLTKILGRATGSRRLNALRETGKRMLGSKHNRTARFFKRWEEHWKGMFVPSTLFEEMGFHYTGPIDGHDLPALLGALHMVKTLSGPQLLHLITTKGKGYKWAEGDQIRYHAVGPFDTNLGLSTAPQQSTQLTYTDVFSQWLCDQARVDTRLMGITPAMREGSGLVLFSQEFPDRYFDVGIAEQHALTLAAGMASRGAKPVVAIYSTFLQRAYDQLIHDIAMQNLDVLLAVDRAGVVGPDGPTHAGNLDLSFLRCIPNLVIMAPADEAECRTMLSTGWSYPGPAVVRYPRGCGPGLTPSTTLDTLPIGQAQVRRHGQHLAILAFGAMVDVAEHIGQTLNLTVVNMRFIKPLDHACLQTLALTHQGLITLEDNVVTGGAGSAVSEWLHTAQVTCSVLQLGLPDAYQAHGTREELLAQAGLDPASIQAAIVQRWPQCQSIVTQTAAAP